MGVDPPRPVHVFKPSTRPRLHLLAQAAAERPVSRKALFAWSVHSSGFLIYHKHNELSAFAIAETLRMR
jgi:hypothetical protein